MNSENGKLFSVAKKNEPEESESQKSETHSVIAGASQCRRKREYVTEATSSDSPKRYRLGRHALQNSHHFEALSDDLLIQISKMGQFSFVRLLIQTGFLQAGPGDNVNKTRH